MGRYPAAATALRLVNLREHDADAPPAANTKNLQNLLDTTPNRGNRNCRLLKSQERSMGRYPTVSQAVRIAKAKCNGPRPLLQTRLSLLAVMQLLRGDHSVVRENITAM